MNSTPAIPTSNQPVSPASTPAVGIGSSELVRPPFLKAYKVTFAACNVGPVVVICDAIEKVPMEISDDPLAWMRRKDIVAIEYAGLIYDEAYKARERASDQMMNGRFTPRV